MDADFNYYETFIQVAPDCPVSAAVVPVCKGANKSVPVLEYESLTANPYFYTQADLIFAVYLERLAIPPGELESRREALWAEFFSKSHACLRASSLPKRYGWGVHFDKDGKIAIYPMEGNEYRQLAGDTALQQLLAMRSKRA